MRTKSNMIPRLLASFPLMIIFLAFTIECEEVNDPPRGNKLLSIDLASDFQNDTVRVELDDQLFYSGTVTTDYSLSLAWRMQVLVSPGSHRVEVSVLNHEALGDTTFNMQDTLTVYVTYERDEINVRFTLYNFLLPYR